MKERLMNNIGLKVLAFLMALMLWLIVVNTDDPVTTDTFYNIPVSVVNEEVLAATNQTYQIVDNTQLVAVTVKAKRSTLNKIKNEDIQAVADMKELTLQTQIPIVASIRGVEYESIEVIPRNLQVKLEDEQTKKFPIVPKTTGTVRDGFVLGEIKAVPEMVSIRGPKSVISSINRVEAEVGVSGLSQDATLPSELVLYDDENNAIDQSLLINNLGVDGVSVSIQVLRTKILPIEFDTSQITAAEGYSFAGVTYEPKQVQVTGTKEELTGVNKLSVPAEALILEGLTSKTERVVEVAKYLPEGIELVDENAGSVVVTIAIEKDGTKSYDISLGAIKVENLPDHLALKFETEDVLEVQIRGPGDVLGKYKINDNVSIDLKGYDKAGVYTVPVSIELPAECTLEKSVSVNIILEER